MEDKQFELAMTISKVLDVIKKLDRRIAEVEHAVNIKNKYYNEGELENIRLISEQVHKIANSL